jgi:hypothetical protein
MTLDPAPEPERGSKQFRQPDHLNRRGEGIGTLLSLFANSLDGKNVVPAGTADPCLPEHHCRFSLPLRHTQMPKRKKAAVSQAIGTNNTGDKETQSLPDKHDFVARLQIGDEALGLPNLLPIVQLRLNGSRPLYFIVDTGAYGGLHLFPSTVRTLGLKASPDPQGGAQRITVDKVTLVGKAQSTEYELKGLSPRLLAAGMSDAGAVNGIAGILGVALFQQHTVQIDPAVKTLSLYTPTKQPVTIPGADVVPLLPSTLTDDPSKREVEVTFPGAGKTRVLLDTGSASLKVPLDYATSITGLRVSYQGSESYNISGKSTVFPARAPEVTVGTRTERTPC